MDTFNLELVFKDELGKSKKVSIKHPKADLTESQVIPALQAIADANIFQGKNGDNYAVPVSARYVSREVKEVYSAAN